MYAIVKNGGKQYKVQEGDILLFDKMDVNPKDEIELEVLLCDNNGDVKIGTPVVENAKVKAEVINHARGEKVVIFKKRRRKDSKRKRGFRRDFTRVRITKIEA